MNNLKRVLSLGLTGAMLTGMMFAGAADFSDADEIKHTEAVNTMAALGVLDGKDNGSYDPTATVTRAEMAKIITVMRNGGETPNIGTKVQPSFTDIKGHWAESYIEYCYNLGIINGRGDGTFDPAGTVTGSEAAKMFLVALGYDADVFGFTGMDWDLNTNRIANSKDAKLYEDLKNINPSEGLNRDNTAQMAYNTLDAVVMDKQIQNMVNNGEITYTYIPSAKFFVEYFDGKVGTATLANTEWDADKETFKYTLTGVSEDNQNKPEIKDSLTSDVDYSALFGMKVKVLTDAKDNVYGMFAKGAVLAEGTVGQLSGVEKGKDTFKLDGTKYTLEFKADDHDEAGKGVGVRWFNDDTTTYNLYDICHAYTEGQVNNTGANDFEKIALIDNNDNGKVDSVVLYNTLAAKVNFAGKTNITVGAIMRLGNAVTATLAWDKDAEAWTCDALDGMFGSDATFAIDKVAKGDWVYIVNDHVGNAPFVAEHADVLEGKVEATKDGEVKIGGEWYSVAENVTAPKLGAEGKFFLVNDYVIGEDTTGAKASVEDTVYALKADPVGDEDSIGAGTQKVQLMFTTGEKKIVTVDKVGAKGEEKAPTEEAKVKADTLYTYKTDKDGNYELTTMVADDYDAVNTDGTKVTDGKTDGTVVRFNADSVVFVKSTDGTVKVVSGDVVAKWAKDTVINNNKTACALYANATNGFNYVAVGAVYVSSEKVPGVAGDSSFGYVVADSVLTKDGDDYAVEMTIWNGTEKVTVLTTEGVKADTSVKDGVYAKGSFISYKDLGNDKIETVKAVGGDAVAVVAYDGGKTLNFKKGAEAVDGDFEITDDTIIVYVNSADKASVEGGSISIADETTTEGTYVNNVRYATEDGSDTKLAVLFVDVANDMK